MVDTATVSTVPEEHQPGPGAALPREVHEARLAGEPQRDPIPGLASAHLRCPNCGTERFEWVPVRNPALVLPCPGGDFPEPVSVAV